MPGVMHKRRSRLRQRVVPGWTGRLDGRGAVARAIKVRELELHAHLGEDVSAIERSLLERLLHVEMLAAKQEFLATTGAATFDVEQYLAIVDRVVRLSSVVGLRPRARLADDLDAYLRERTTTTTPTEAAPTP